MILSDLSRSKLLAVDPSLTASGWALFSFASRKPLAVGVIAPPGASCALAERLYVLQQHVADVVELCGAGDILICEGPAPLVLNPSSSIKVERVRSIFEAVARERGLSVPGRVNPRTVQTELLGMSGRQLARRDVKSWARDTAVKLYSSELKNLTVHVVPERRGSPRRAARNSGPQQIPQDVIDALLIGTLALSRIAISAKTGMPLSSAFESRRGQRAAAGGRRVNWCERDLAKVRPK